MKPKRILTDAAGYGLIVLGGALGWLPGPGGIPLVLAGLGLLSINNAWAQRLRNYLIKHSGRLAEVMFPPTPWAQWAYDAVVVALIVIAGVLAKQHAAVWQVSLAIALFFIMLLIAGLNRDRYKRLKNRLSAPKPKA